MLTIHKQRKKRALRVRKHVRGDSSRPRLCVLKTNRHLHVQIIDDVEAKTLVSAATFGKNAVVTKKSKENAKLLGAHVAKIAKEKGISKVKFDRGSCKYHGILEEFAQAAREAGLEF